MEHRFITVIDENDKTHIINTLYVISVNPKHQHHTSKIEQSIISIDYGGSVRCITTNQNINKVMEVLKQYV